MSERNVEFARKYNHTFPSRAMAEYPAGWKGTVPLAVAQAAGAAGYLVGVKGKTAPTDELPRNVPKLKKIARDEGVELGDATTADAIAAAITAARSIVSAPPSPSSATPAAPAAPINSAPTLPAGADSE